MTNHLGRLYALAAALVLFFLSWVAIAARPWQDATAASTDPRLAQLAAREAKLRDEAVRVQKILDRRFATYRTQLATRQQQNQTIRDANAQLAAAARVAVLPASTPPVTTTRSS